MSERYDYPQKDGRLTRVIRNGRHVAWYDVPEVGGLYLLHEQLLETEEEARAATESQQTASTVRLMR